MAGFDNDVVYGTNVDFRGVKPRAAQVTADGELLIGATASPNIRVGSLSSTGGTITITPGAGTINLETAGGAVGNTITGDAGGALSPIAGNWNILGGPGVTTTGSGSTLTINSVVYTDEGGSTTVASDSGSFATAAITLTTPAAPAQGELLEFVATSAAALVVDAASTHLIRIGNQITSAGGTVTSTAIGDSLSLRYRLADTTWYATSVIGNWTVA